VNNDFNNALAHYNSSLQLDPQFYPALFQIGYDAELRGDHASAKDAFTKAKGFPQTASLAAFNLGLIDLLLNDLPNAEQNFQFAVEKDAKFLKAYDKLGETYEQEKQPDKALAAYMKARDIKETDTYSELRVAHILFDQGKWRDAAKAAKKAREAGVDSVDVYLIEADSWFHVKDYLQAWDLANRGTQLRAGANMPRLWYIMAASDMKIKNQADRGKTELDKLQTLDAVMAKELQDGSK
jgi:Flp pilus assembly protein TadD